MASLKEAFVLMLRFTKFHDLIRTQKSVQTKSAPYQKLRRDLIGVITVLEELKPRLAKLLGEAPATPLPEDAAAAPDARDEVAIDMATQLERRWASFQPAVRPKPTPA